MSWIANAKHRMKPRLIALALIGTAVLFTAAMLWLQIPDSYAWQFVLSVLLAALIFVGSLWLYTTLLRALRATAHPAKFWLGAALLSGWTVVWWLIISASSHIMDKAYQRAGYWNSQLSSSMRQYFTYVRLWDWQDNAVTILLWVVVTGVLLPFLIETVSCGFIGAAWARAIRTLADWRHWLTVIVAATLMYWLTDKLIAWQPSHSVRGELVSAVLRIGLICALDALLVIVVIAAVAELLAQRDTGGNPLAQPPSENTETIPVE